MSNNNNFLFRQVPIYNSDDTFLITSEELNMMVKMAEFSSEYMSVFEHMIARLVDINKVKIHYTDQTG